MTSFYAFCADDGTVLHASPEDFVRAGVPLTASLERPSVPKALQMLVDSRKGVGHALLERHDGLLVETFCAANESGMLVVGGSSPDEVRAACARIPVSGSQTELLARITRAAAADELSIDLWGELARLNNDLTTAHRALAKSNAELRRLNELKNELLGIAAHDLRNPLAAILAYATFLEEGRARLAADDNAMVERIRVNTENMLALVEDVLDFSAVESGTLRLADDVFELEPLVREVVEVCSVLARVKQVSIAAAVDPDAAPVAGDRRRIAQVLQNLLSNAVKFSHPRTLVTLAAGSAGEHVWISVTDRGVGMDAEQATQLFKPFASGGSRPTAGEKSTGLGLAIVDRIVRAHRGKIEVASAPGEGTTFTVLLPAASAVLAPECAALSS